MAHSNRQAETNSRGRSPRPYTVSFPRPVVSWIDRNRLWILLALVAVTTVLVAGTVAAGVLAVLAGLLAGASVGAVLTDAALFLGLTALLVAADLAFGLAFFVTVVRSASLPTSARLANWLSRVERVVPPLRALGLAGRFEPSLETKRERLKRRYVSGELTEPEYERELKKLLDDEDETVVGMDDVDRIDANLLAAEDGTDPSAGLDGSEPTDSYSEHNREYERH